jgi:Xaa-Pro aminopeptidase
LFGHQLLPLGNHATGTYRLTARRPEEGEHVVSLALSEVSQDLEVIKQLERRRSAVAEAWDLEDEIVLIGAGDRIGIPGRGDPTYPYHAHTEFFYLTDRNRPGGVLAYDPADGWQEFAPPLEASERLWLGTDPDPPEVLSIAKLPDRIRGRRVACLGVPQRGHDAELTAALRAELDRIRRPKDALELQRMRAAEHATAMGFAAVQAFLTDGTSERGAQIELEAEAFRNGGDAMAYDSIIAGGPNAAALHFAPSAREMRAGELVLIDAGAERLGYASDITRTYPVGGQMTSEQQELHALVHAAQRAAIAQCGPGVEWRDVHLTATREIASGLVACGILRGEPDALIEQGAVWLFFPHGIGHLVGLGVRDAGGIMPGRQPVFPQLRIDLPLEPGMVVTVEPGMYFARALLEDPDQRTRYRDAVAWERVDRLLDFGGIRIEDNVLITDQGHEVITRDVPVL